MKLFNFGGNLKKVSVFALITAVLLFANLAQSQEIDSLILTSAECMPGDTATIALVLNNQSFSVGGFRAIIVLPDSVQAQFVYAYNGEDIEYFDYINFAPFTVGVVGVTGIASMPPRQSPPLPIGSHELAFLKIAISETVPPGTTLSVIFSLAEDYDNAISDSSGNIVIEPSTANGQIIIGQPVGIGGDFSVPRAFELISNYPNPFNATTTISFTVSAAGYANLTVYDIQGQRVCQLMDEYLTAGHYGVVWNGLTDDGKAVASGIYFYRLTHNNEAVTKKMNLVK